MRIRTTRFGDIEVADANILSFSHGIPGFPEEKSFAFLIEDEESPFAFLQSATNPDLTFIIVDPFNFFKDYEFKLDDDIAAELEVCQDNPPNIFCIVTVPEKVEEMTANLLAPIVINWDKRIGRQIILEKTAYTTRHRMFPDGFPKDNAEGGK